jgi:hypothetical protein
MSTNKKQNNLIYFICGGVGLLTGIAAAYLLVKNKEGSTENKAVMNSKDGLRIGVSLASLLGQVSEMGKA